MQDTEHKNKKSTQAHWLQGAGGDTAVNFMKRENAQADFFKREKSVRYLRLYAKIVASAARILERLIVRLAKSAKILYTVTSKYKGQSTRQKQAGGVSLFSKRQKSAQRR